MKQIILTPASDADLGTLLNCLEKFIQTLDYKPSVAFRAAMSRCTGLEWTSVPLPGWQSVETRTDACPALDNTAQRLLDCRADVLALLELIPEYKPGFVPDQVRAAADRILSKIYPD